MVKGDRIELTFLSGKRPLTKQISKTDIVPYPHLKQLTSHVELVDNIRDFASAIQAHAGNGDALLVGRLTRQIKESSRAGLTDKSAMARWICLDFDGLPGYSPQAALKQLEKVWPKITQTSHVIQYSASSRLFSKTDLRCHIFFMLDEPLAPLTLKNWFINANLNTKFSQFIELTPAGVALHYPLDPALAEQSRIIFISTPVFTPASLDPHPDDRLQYVEAKYSELNVAAMSTQQPVYNELQKQMLERAKELRKQRGLSTNKRFKAAFKDDFCPNPDPCEVTGIKHDRGYVYLNLNGGDSWGYWYPDNDPSILYNFKGEPNYPLDKIVPDYFNMYVASSNPSHNPSGPGALYFVFQDDYTGKTHSCIYNSNTGQLDISATISDTAARRWLASHNQNPRFFHVVTTFYDPRPAALLGVDLRLRTINTYQPPALTLIESAPRKVPKTIDTVLRHVLNQPDEDPLVSREYEHFLDWLAFIVQTRERTGTAWLLHGTQGTGKGVLMHKILRPLVGDGNFSVINMQTMAERFTDRLDDKLLVGLDEIKREDFTKHPGLMNRLKNTITEETITSRRFQNAPKESMNFVNFILTSNEQVPMEIPANDRRFNVAYGQPFPLRTKFGNNEGKTNQAVNITIANELPAFYTFLMKRTVSRGDVSLAIDNKAKEAMVRAGRTATQSFFDAIQDGFPVPFQDEYRRLQNPEWAATSIMENPTVIGHDTIEKFGDFIEEYMPNGAAGPVVITREQMSILARIMLGKKIPMTPQRYMSWLSQFGLAEVDTKCPVRNETIRGVLMLCQPQEHS